MMLGLVVISSLIVSTHIVCIERSRFCDDAQEIASEESTALLQVRYLAALGGSVKQPGHVNAAFSLGQLAPFGLFVLGVALLLSDRTRCLGLLALFFGAQTFMNVFMKAIFSHVAISNEKQLYGVQAPFAVTAAQQLVSFAVVMLGIAISRLTPWPYESTHLVISNTYQLVALLSLFFFLNIGLNNFSLSLLPISVNLVIRSTTPLVAAFMQLIIAYIMNKPAEMCTRDFGLPMVGTLCAVLVVLSQTWGAHATTSATTMLVGCVICVCSVFASAAELMVVSTLGNNNVRMGPVVMCCCMALPVSCLLLPPIFCWAHPVSWPGHARMVDAGVLKVILDTNPSVISIVLVSGVVAIAYNMVLYAFVQQFSPTHATLASGFNKAAAIALSVAFGFERLPPGYLGLVLVLAIVGNIASFGFYSSRKGLRAEPKSEPKLEFVAAPKPVK